MTMRDTFDAFNSRRDRGLFGDNESSSPIHGNDPVRFDLIDIPVALHHETDKAVLLSPDADERKAQWIIDGTFPDYERVIPQRAPGAMMIESAELDAALTRILAASDPEGRLDVVKLSWGDDPAQLTISIQTADASGSEVISCESAGQKTGDVGLQCHYLRRLIGVLGGENIRLFVNSPGEPVRLENPLSENAVAVCMPCRA